MLLTSVVWTNYKLGLSCRALAVVMVLLYSQLKTVSSEYTDEWTSCSASCYPGGTQSQKTWTCSDTTCTHKKNVGMHYRVCNRHINCEAVPTATTTTAAPTTTTTAPTTTTVATTTMASNCDNLGGLQALIDGPVYNIYDSKLYTSSDYSYLYAAQYSRLNKCPTNRNIDCAWTSEDMAGETITADLGQTFLVGKIATQGDGDTDPYNFIEYVTRFKLFYSTDGYSFTQINNGGSNFIGNSDSTSVKEQYLPYYVAARYIKLQIVDYVRLPSLRWELYGCLV